MLTRREGQGQVLKNNDATYQGHCPRCFKVTEGSKSKQGMWPRYIGPRLLRELSEQIASPLTTIFQQSLHDGIVPGDWHKANITPVF